MSHSDIPQRRGGGEWSRRGFLARTSALGLMLAGAGTWVGHEVWAQGPKKGGRLRIGMAGGSTTDSLDPATITDIMMLSLSMGQLRNCLVEIDAQSNPIPELAESWEPSADASVWRFKLRQGVTFHDGKSLEAEDVMASFNHHRGEDSKSAAKSLLKTVKSIQADGKNTVVFELSEGNADFPFITSDYHLTIQPAGADLSKGIGTGGYILQDFEPGVRARTKRNPNYWKEGRAHFDEIEMTAIADVNARTNALKTGEIDVMNRSELKTVHLLKRTPGLQVLQTNGTKHYTMPMHTDVKPFDNNDVRLALKHAVDRQALLKTVLRGYGTLGNDHPIGRSQRYYARDLPQREYDPDKAKFHLKKAGLSSLKVKLSAADAAYEGAVDSAVLYKEHAAPAGIEIEVVREPKDGYWDNVWLKKPFCMCYWSGRPTSDWMFTTAYAADAPWNDSHFKHDRFNALLKAARAELDDGKRRRMYADMQHIVRDEGGTIIPMFASDVYAASDQLRFGEVGANWELDGGKIAERWWWA
ncbi:ABC transporter substrate-binding protein [Candidatus Entotheonella palauensis]|uniref:ABC transporter substrate-binding protein n=1 Tax=Candidatus Entotheonella palauensis TaxID=93172 RepID=UPI00277B580A|nr:ABC transporter substrate-binding protein [Candidatus Entotheonella palauensis]